MNLTDIEKDRPIVVVGAGGTLADYADAVREFVERTNAATIGINKMTSILVPTYHLWTNKARWSEFGGCIHPDSKMLFGEKMPVKLIRKHFDGDFTRVRYEDRAGLDVGISDGVIRGHFRTAGALAIVVASLMGSSDIRVVGMDGYTLHGRRDLDASKEQQHCYGSGFTDDATWDECKNKDNLVYESLRKIHRYGVDFKILTPTVFRDFYDPKELKTS